MKKLAILVLSGVILGAGYINVYGMPFKVINKQEQKQLEQYKQEEKRIEEIKQLHSPQYIEEKLHKAGKIITLEGTYKYQDTITEKGVWGYVTLREISLDLQYQFGIGLDLQYVKVNQVDNIMTIKIPKERIQLMYLQLNHNQSRVIDGKKMLLVSQFEPSEIEIILEQSQQNTANKIGNSKVYFDMAVDNLKGELEKFVLGFNYEKIIFEVV